MQYQTLGKSDLEVSRIALGTMTFGRQNSEAEAFEQLDYALAQGINLIDAAEMYPIPTAAEFQGRTEQYIGNWLRRRGCREQVILATKAAGPGAIVSYLRPNLHHDEANLRAALEAVWPGCRPIISTCTSCTGPIARPTFSASWATSTTPPPMHSAGGDLAGTERAGQGGQDPLHRSLQ